PVVWDVGQQLLGEHLLLGSQHADPGPVLQILKDEVADQVGLAAPGLADNIKMAVAVFLRQPDLDLTILEGVIAERDPFHFIHPPPDLGGQIRWRDAAVNQPGQLVAADGPAGDVAKVVGEEEDDLAALLDAAPLGLLPCPLLLALAPGGLSGGRHERDDKEQYNNEAESFHCN